MTSMLNGPFVMNRIITPAVQTPGIRTSFSVELAEINFKFNQLPSILRFDDEIERFETIPLCFSVANLSSSQNHICHKSYLHCTTPEFINFSF